MIHGFGCWSADAYDNAADKQWQWQWWRWTAYSCHYECMLNVLFVIESDYFCRDFHSDALCRSLNTILFHSSAFSARFFSRTGSLLPSSLFLAFCGCRLWPGVSGIAVANCLSVYVEANTIAFPFWSLLAVNTNSCWVPFHHSVSLMLRAVVSRCYLLTIKYAGIVY